MKIKIQEIYWSHNYMTGAHLEKAVAETVIDAVVGPIPEFGANFKGFAVGTIDGDTVVIIPPEKDKCGNTAFIVRPGKPHSYSPYSRNGYKYDFEVMP